MRKLLISLVFFALAACGQPAATPTPEAPTIAPAATTPPTSAPAATPTAPPVATVTSPDAPYPGPGQAYPGPDATPPASANEAAAQVAEEARQRLAQHLGVDPSTLTLQSSTPQEWPNGAIGCPAPDQNYIQAFIPGYLLTFGDGTRTYEVHTTLQAAPGEPMVLCENRLPVSLAIPTTPPSTDATGQQMVDLAKQDLARQLGIDVSAVEVITISPVQWPDSSLGCPKPDTTYMQVVTPGFLVVLQAQGRPYEYHTDSSSQVVQCGP